MYSSGLACTKLVHFATKDAEPATAWRLLVVIGAVPATVLVVFIILFVPESPIWLAMQQASDEEKKGLAEEEADEGSGNPPPKRVEPWNHIRLLLFEPALRPPVFYRWCYFSYTN